eukprot:3015382-Prymnesium_polylepis.2
MHLRPLRCASRVCSAVSATRSSEVTCMAKLITATMSTKAVAITRPRRAHSMSGFGGTVWHTQGLRNLWSRRMNDVSSPL